MKNKNLYLIANSLSKLNNLQGADFTLHIIKNEKKIIDEIKLIEAAKLKIEDKELIDQNKKYESEQLNIDKKYAVIEDNGKPLVIQGTYVINNVPAFNNDCEVLKLTFPKLVTELDRINKHNDELMVIESKIELCMIKEDIVPKNISVEQRRIIFDLLADS